MPDDFSPRQITFTIAGRPGVLVTATENGVGDLDFTLDVSNARGRVGDLGHLYFDMADSKLPGLSYSSKDGFFTQMQVKPTSLLDVLGGRNMGVPFRKGYDVGIEWGREGIGRGRGDIDTVQYTLSNAARNLTLDDIAHQRFEARLTSVGMARGSRTGTDTISTIAPAAPDARDDTYTIFEDNARGLDDPSKTPSTFKMAVLTNDTDADGDALTITAIRAQPEHGTISIVDGGKSLLYTPQTDWSGQVTVQYAVSDGHGGQDNATAVLNITPVADVPVLDVTVAGTGNVNEVLITVVATQSDADASEYIDSIVASALPAGVTIAPASLDPSDQPDQLTKQFLVTLPKDQDTAFDLTFTATAKEEVNGDTATSTYTVPIKLDYNHTDVAATFTANDQSIWDSGDEFRFVDDRFLGVDTGEFNETFGSTLYAGISGHIKLGFQSTLEFEGGSINATADYDIDVDTNYNRTTDALAIDIGSALKGATFNTEGPTGSYILDFIYDVYLDAKAGIDIDLGTVDFDPLDIIPGDQTEEIGRIKEETHFGGPFDLGSGSFNLIDLNSDDLGGSIQLPKPLDSISLNFAWPNIETSGTALPNPAVGTGESNNFFEVVLDVDTLATQLLKLPNIFDPEPISIGPFFADPDILDVDVIGGLNFLQKFTMEMGDLVGLLNFEDGSSRTFDFGAASLLLARASAIDAAGDNDGIVEFSLTVGPEAQLNNDTDLGFNIGAELSLFTVEVGYDLGGAIGESTTFGPVADLGVTAPLGSIGVFDSTFALNFTNNSYAFAA